MKEMMKSGSVLLVLLLISFAACKQNSAEQPKPKEVTESEFEKYDKKQPARQTVPVSADQSNPELKQNIQGRWKPVKEKGVVYEFKNDQVIRYLNDKPEFTAEMECTKDFGLNCGQMNKKYGRMGHVGCISFKGVNSACFWVFNRSQDQIDLIRMGKVEEEPDTWMRM